MRELAIMMKRIVNKRTTGNENLISSEVSGCVK